MKTKKAERAGRLEMLEQNVKDGGTFHRGVLDVESHLIADVEDARGLLKRTGEALEYGGACTCIEADIDEPIPPCPRCEIQPLVADFLKEPKS